MFGELLRGYRRRLGLTQEELAAETGVNARTIGKLESGQIARPRQSTVRLLADAFGLVGTDRAAFLSATGEDATRPAAARTAAVRMRPQQVPAQLPADVPGFVGRTQPLDDLTTLLSDGGGVGVARGAVLITAIGGIAGVGKTALAIHWGHRTRDRFPDGQLYVNMHGYSAARPIQPADVLPRFLRAMGVPAEMIPSEVEESAALYRSLLADRRLLIVLDNVRSADQVRPLLPGSASCFVLVTSRERLDALVAIDGAHRLDLDVLPLADAMALLSYVIGEDRVRAEPTATADLAVACGYLPLALRITAAQLTSRPRRLLAEQVAALKADRLGALSVGDDMFASVERALNLSYETLPADASTLLGLLSLSPAPDLSVAAIAALASLPSLEVARLLGVLDAAHLVTAASPGRFGMHDLVRLHALRRTQVEQSEARRQEAIERLLDWYADTTVRANLALQPTWQPPPWAPVFPPSEPYAFMVGTVAMEWLEQEHITLRAVTRHAATGSAARVVWPIVLAQTNFFMRSHRATTMVELNRLGFEVAAERGQVEAQATHAQSLGIGYSLLRQTDEAVEWYQRALALNEKIGHLNRIARTHTNLGALYSEVNQLSDAARHLHLALDIARRIGDRGVESGALANLGWVYLRTGSRDLAVSTLLEALALIREAGLQQAECHAEGNLGAAYLEQGRWAEATSHLEAGLRLAVEIGDPLAEARDRLSLGDVHRALGATGDARAEWQAAHAIFVELDHPEAEHAQTRLRESDANNPQHGWARG